MYLRTTQRRNKDGSIVRYVQVAHNRKVDGVTHADVAWSYEDPLPESLPIAGFLCFDPAHADVTEAFPLPPP